MPLKSDIIIDAGKFDPANNPEQVNKFNEAIVAMFSSAVDWWELQNIDRCDGLERQASPYRPSHPKASMSQFPLANLVETYLAE